MQVALVTGVAYVDRAVFEPNDGEPIHLTTREADTLRFFATNPLRTITRDDLLAQVFGYADAALSRATDNVVARLRRKIERDPARPVHLVTVHGAGYRFVPLAPEPVAPPAEAIAPVGDPFRIGAVVMDVARHRLQGPRGVCDLTSTQAELLRVLLASSNTVGHEVLRRKAKIPTRRALDSQMSRIRARIEEVGGDALHLVTIRGSGYRLAESLPSADSVHSQRSAPQALIGRDDVLRAIGTALGLARVVTLVGPGGAGKTRLSQRWAANAGHLVVWVDADRDLATAIPAALRIPAPRVLGAAFRDRGPCVLVLDGAERAPPDVQSLVGELIAAAPDLRILACSRRRLGIDGERIVEVGPLDLRDAVALFRERADALGAAVAADDDVAKFVARLDGLPLAIEIAAARLRVASVQELLERTETDRRLDVLVDPEGTLPSLRTVIAASVDHLDPAVREALSSLALFPGPFSLAAAEEVLGCGLDGLDRVQVLRDHSLIRPLGGRLVLYDTVRAYVREQPIPKDVRRRFVARFAQFGSRGHLVRLARSDVDLQCRVREELDGILAAGEIALALGATDDAAQCTVAALHVLMLDGHVARALALAGTLERSTLPPGLASDAAMAHAFLLRAVDRSEEAVQEFLAAAASARRADDPWREHRAFAGAGVTSMDYVDRDGAARCYRQAIEAGVRASDPAAVEIVRGRWADLEANADAAEVHFLRGLTLARRQRDASLEFVALALLAKVDFRRARMESARTWSEAAMALAASLGDWPSQVNESIRLMAVLSDLGANDEAVRLADRYAELARRLGTSTDEAALLVQRYGILAQLDPARAEASLASLRPKVEAQPGWKPKALLDNTEAWVAFAARDFGRCRWLSERAMSRYAAAGDSWMAGECELRLGYLDAAAGRWPEARSRLEGTLQLLRGALDPEVTIGALCWAARAALEGGERTVATAWLGEACTRADLIQLRRNAVLLAETRRLVYHSESGLVD